jgi:hypothetical protein
MDKLQRPNLGRVFSFRSVHLHVAHLRCVYTCEFRAQFRIRLAHFVTKNIFFHYLTCQLSAKSPAKSPAKSRQCKRTFMALSSKTAQLKIENSAQTTFRFSPVTIHKSSTVLLDTGNNF